jgi:hypothetical protein
VVIIVGWKVSAVLALFKAVVQRADDLLRISRPQLKMVVAILTGQLLCGGT